jgi:hypothetical protein
MTAGDAAVPSHKVFKGCEGENYTIIFDMGKGGV